MTDCQQYQDDLKAYCDNELPLLRRIAVRRHLSRCAACRKEVTQMEQLGNDLRSSDTAVLDPALRTKILANIADSQPGVSIPPVVRARGRWKPVRILAAAGAVLVFAGWVHYTTDHAAPPAAHFEVSASSRFMPQAASSARTAPGLPPPAVTAAPTARYAAPADSGRVAPQWHASSGATRYNAAQTPQSAAVPADTPLRRVHKEGSITVEVGNPEEKGNAVEQMVKSVGGFVAANNLTTAENGLKSSEMIVKVPEPQFETIVGQIAKLGEVKAKNITGEDITEKISDSDRAENVLEDEVQKAEAQLKLKAKKATWQDQETARDLRIQLSQERARLDLLKKMAALANITVTLTEKPKAEPTPATGFVPDMKTTTGAAIGSLVSSAASLLSVVIWILAYSPIWIPALFGGRYIYRQYQRKNAGQGV